MTFIRGCFFLDEAHLKYNTTMFNPRLTQGVITLEEIEIVLDSLTKHPSELLLYNYQKRPTCCERNCGCIKGFHDKDDVKKW